MESIIPPPSNSTHPSDSDERDAVRPAIVHLTKQQYIQLKWDSRYWQRQHEQAIAHEAALKLELEQAEASLHDLRQWLYGKQSEKSSLLSEAQSDDDPLGFGGVFLDESRSWSRPSD